MSDEAGSADWPMRPLSSCVRRLNAGVSVNAEDRPHGAGEVGVLKTSALSGGSFRPQENKAVLPAEQALVQEPVREDSVLISRMNTPALVGECCYVSRDYPTLYLPDRLWQVERASPDAVDMRWLAYMLRTPTTRRYIDAHATGTSGSMKNLPKSALLSMRLPFPSVPEQRQIARILDTLDTQIRRTEELIGKLSLIKQGLLTDLLTRGIDENGQLRPPPDQAQHLYKDSPLGRIPREWEYALLGEAADWFSGGTPPRTGGRAWEGSIPFLTPKDMKRFALGDTSEHITLEAARGASRVMPEETVFVVVRGMILAHTFPVCLSEQPFAFNQDIKAVRGRVGLRTRYLGRWFLAHASLFLGKATASTHGTKKLDSAELHRTPIALPPLDEQDHITARLAQMDEALAKECAAYDKLKMRKPGLMDDLLTGRIRVTPLLDKAERAAS